MAELSREAIVDLALEMLGGGATLDQVIAAAANYGVDLEAVYYSDPGTVVQYVEPEPVYYAPEPEPVYYAPEPEPRVYVAPEPVYEPEPVYIPPAPPVVAAPVVEDRFTADQYAQAGQFILKNLDKPEVIVQTAAELGLTVEEITKAAQTVDETVTVAQVETYLEQAEPVYVQPTPYPEPVPAPLVVKETIMPTYTAEQYAAAGEWMLANLDNPALIAQRAAELDLSVEELTLAAQTVNPEITVDAVEDYFVDNNVNFDKPFEGGIYAFSTAAERDAYLASGDPNLRAFYEAQGQPFTLTQPVVQPVTQPVVQPVAQPVVRPVVQQPLPRVVTPAPIVSPVPIIPAPVQTIVPPATTTEPPAAPPQAAAGNVLPVALIAAYLLLGA
jgi:hypothetical protein